MVLVAVCLAVAAIACKSERSRVTVQNEEPPPESHLLSTIPMNNAAAAPQLLSGFYAVENNMWRWTAGKFSVRLGVPPAAAQSGVTVALSFVIPDAAIRKLQKITIAASAGGMQLNSQSYDTAGPYVFNADIPAGPLLNSESVTVDFTVDKTFRPDGGDRRDLAIIANSVSLAAK